MLKRVLCLVCCLALLVPCLGLAEEEIVEDVLLEDDEEEILAEVEEEVEIATADEDDLAWLEESDEDDDLVPLTEEELLNILADDSSFVVLPDDFSIDDENVFTLLLIGSDSYFADKRGRSDAVILVQLNAKAKTIKMASFMRDMYVTIPGKGKNRLNASYIWGGEKLLRRTLQANFGVTADAYVEVNFTRMIDVIDRIGGVEVEVSEKEMTQVNSILKFYNVKVGDKENDQLLTEYGPNTHLTGKQALCFSRIRKIDGDAQRTARQRKVLEAAFRKVVSLDLGDLMNLVISNMDAVKTDLTLEQLTDLIPKALLCRNAEFSTLAIPYPGTYKNSTRDGMSVVTLDFDKNQEKLWDFFAVD